METGMTNLGSGGEAKASPADREDILTDNGMLESEPGVPQAPTRLGVVPSSYGEAGGSVADDAEGLPPA